MRLGYNPTDIIKSFFYYFIKIFGIVASLGLLVFFVFKYFLDEMFASGGLYIDTEMTYFSIISLLISYTIFAIASFNTAKRGIFKQF